MFWRGCVTFDEIVPFLTLNISLFQKNSNLFKFKLQMFLPPGVDLITLFCNLDHFINIRNICWIAMKCPNLQKRVSKFTPKKFYEIDPSYYQGKSYIQVIQINLQMPNFNLLNVSWYPKVFKLNAIHYSVMCQ